MDRTLSVLDVLPTVEVSEIAVIQELNDLEMSTVGGGCGEFTPY